MVNNRAEYQKYLEAINTLAGMQRETEKSRQELTAKQSVQQKQLEAERQKQIQQLDKIREAATDQFRDLSLLFREVCSVPATVAAPESCSIPLADAARIQGAAAATLKQALDSIIAQRLAAKQRAISMANDRREKERQETERKRLEEQRRLNEELRRRQQELDSELQRAGWKPSSPDDYRVKTRY